MQLLKTVVIMTFAVFICFSLNGFSGNDLLKAVPDVVDFGTIEEGEFAASTVMVQNTGTVPLEITNVRTN